MINLLQFEVYLNTKLWTTIMTKQMIQREPGTEFDRLVAGSDYTTDEQNLINKIWGQLQELRMEAAQPLTIDGGNATSH